MKPKDSLCLLVSDSVRQSVSQSVSQQSCQPVSQQLLNMKQHHSGFWFLCFVSFSDCGRVGWAMSQMYRSGAVQENTPILYKSNSGKLKSWKFIKSLPSTGTTRYFSQQETTSFLLFSSPLPLFFFFFGKQKNSSFPDSARQRSLSQEISLRVEPSWSTLEMS